MASNYAQDDTGYLDRYVAFLDILGFSQLTEKADKHPNWRAWLRDCVAALHATVPPKVEATGFRFVQFSDSIVLSAPRNAGGLNAVLWGTKLLANNMLGRGILLRGGIAAGHFHHDDHLMFGPALVRAYAFEQHGAPPHIGLHESVIEDLKPSLISHGHQDWLVQDPWDLSPMLHTLIDYGSYDGIPRPGGVVLEGQGVGLARMIHQYATDMTAAPAVRAKWRWQQDYWNQTVAPKAILSLSKETDWEAEMQRVTQAEQQRLALQNLIEKGGLPPGNG